MTHTEEQKLLQDMATLIERVEGLPCRNSRGCQWSLKQKAVAGTGITGAIAAIILALYTYLSGGQR